MNATNRRPAAPEQIEQLRALVEQDKLTVAQAAERLGVNRRRAYHLASVGGVQLPGAGRFLGRRPAVTPSLGIPTDADERLLAAAHELADGLSAEIAKLLDGDLDRKSTRLNSSHIQKSRMPSSA